MKFVTVLRTMNKMRINENENGVWLHVNFSSLVVMRVVGRKSGFSLSQWLNGIHMQSVVTIKHNNSKQQFMKKKNAMRLIGIG